MIYSVWKPDTGGYTYLETTGTQNLNDDLPTPDLPKATKIGVPSIEAGRPVPTGSTFAGSGELPVGLVAPVDESRIVRRTRSLAGLGSIDAASSPPLLWILAGAAGAAIIWSVIRKR